MGLVEFDPFKVIRAALKGGGEFADIYVEDTYNTSIVCEENRIEKVITGRDMGCGIRVISNLKTCYAYTNDLTEKGLLDLSTVVSKGVREGAGKGDIGTVRKEAALGFDIKKLPVYSPLEEKVKLVKKANSTAWSMDKRLRQARVV